MNTCHITYSRRLDGRRDDIREEQLRLRGGDRTKPVTTDMIDAMQITRACVKETLRSRPPPIMLARKVSDRKRRTGLPSTHYVCSVGPQAVRGNR